MENDSTKQPEEAGRKQREQEAAEEALRQAQAIAQHPGAQEALRQAQAIAQHPGAQEALRQAQAVARQPGVQEALNRLHEQAKGTVGAFEQLVATPSQAALASFARFMEDQNQQIQALLQQTYDESVINEVRSLAVGAQSALTVISRSIGQLPKEFRPAAGQIINKTKREVETELTEKTEQIRQLSLENTLEAERLDVTLPGRPRALGSLHVVTETIRDIVAAFVQMGFEVVEGPEIEMDRYNFELLNIPPEHPARSLHDTFYIAGNEQLVLRTHTSPNQIRVMQREKPPIRVVVPGKCYREEATDATHEAYFYQIEGLAVDKNITLADLKGTLAALARALFGQHRKVRFRCDYFPYVEPGVDLAIDCQICGGKGCRSCKYTGFLEIMGAGMVHPQVLRNGGIDPDVYSGFAFGMGPERIAMLRHGIDDIRLFYANNLRFLRQFS